MRQEEEEKMTKIDVVQFNVWHFYHSLTLQLAVNHKYFNACRISC